MYTERYVQSIKPVQAWKCENVFERVFGSWPPSVQLKIVGVHAWPLTRIDRKIHIGNQSVTIHRYSRGDSKGGHIQNVHFSKKTYWSKNSCDYTVRDIIWMTWKSINCWTWRKVERERDVTLWIIFTSIICALWQIDFQCECACQFELDLRWWFLWVWACDPIYLDVHWSLPIKVPFPEVARCVPHYL